MNPWLMGLFAAAFSALAGMLSTWLPPDEETPAEMTPAEAQRQAQLADSRARAEAASVHDPKIILSPERLRKAYEMNEVAADRAYLGKALQMYGVVKAVSYGQGDDVVVSLEQDDESLVRDVLKVVRDLTRRDDEPDVLATLASSEWSSAARLQKGQFVLLFCTGGGRVGDALTVRNCTLRLY